MTSKSRPTLVGAPNVEVATVVLREAGVKGMDRLPEKRRAFRLHRELVVEPDGPFVEKHVMIGTQAEHVPGHVWAVVRGTQRLHVRGLCVEAIRDCQLHIADLALVATGC
jgi:hypothetical protein